MATTVTVNSNYEGKEAGSIIGKAFKEADTLRLGLVSVIDNIDFKVHLRKIDYGNGRQDFACNFNPQGSLDLSEVTLEPKKIMNNLEICKQDLRNIWSSPSMGASAFNERMPVDVETALLAEIMEEHSEYTDNNIWNGASATGGEFGGFIEKFLLDANVIKANNGIAPGGAPITEANVLSELKKVLTAIPLTIRRNQLVVGVSPDVMNAYSFYLTTQGIANTGDPLLKQMRFAQYTLTEINGLPTNTIVAYEKKNLYFGTGLLSDHNQIDIIDQRLINASNNVLVNMVFTAGVQYVRPEEIVYYHSTVV